MAPTQKTTVTSLGEHLPQESTGTPTHATLHPTPNPTHHLHVATAVQKGLSSHQNSIFVLFLELIHLSYPVKEVKALAPGSWVEDKGGPRHAPPPASRAQQARPWGQMGRV